MKKLILLAACLSMGTAAAAKDVYVRGYVRSDGTYVQPHYRSAPDSNPYNNYSTSPNYNPYTGRQGTVTPYSTPSYSPPRYSPPTYSPPVYSPPTYKAPCYGYGC